MSTTTILVVTASCSLSQTIGWIFLLTNTSTFDRWISGCLLHHVHLFGSQNWTFKKKTKHLEHFYCKYLMNNMLCNVVSLAMAYL